LDSKQFEGLSRRVGAATTRRGALKVLAGGVGASVFALLRAYPSRADVDPNNLPKDIPIVNCKFTLQKCQSDRACCSGYCRQSVKLDPAPDPLEIPLPPPSTDVLEVPLPDEVEGGKNGVCDCRPKGTTCYVLLEGAFCCSGKCHDAKCT
jgi:hypothetical protein